MLREHTSLVRTLMEELCFVGRRAGTGGSAEWPWPTPCSLAGQAGRRSVLSCAAWAQRQGSTSSTARLWAVWPPRPPLAAPRPPGLTSPHLQARKRVAAAAARHAHVCHWVGVRLEGQLARQRVRCGPLEGAHHAHGQRPLGHGRRRLGHQRRGGGGGGQLAAGGAVAEHAAGRDGRRVRRLQVRARAGQGRARGGRAGAWNATGGGRCAGHPCTASHRRHSPIRPVSTGPGAAAPTLTMAVTSGRPARTASP